MSYLISLVQTMLPPIVFQPSVYKTERRVEQTGFARIVNQRDVALRPTRPAERNAVNALLRETLQIPANATALHEDFQQWKYWGEHPWHIEPRSRILERAGSVAAHVCMWPLRFETTSGTYFGFHPIDWGAKRGLPGAGLQVLRSCFRDKDAAFSLGGSEMTQKILPRFGFKPQNEMTLLARPLHALQPAWTESPRDWKMAARLVRNYLQHAPKSLALRAPWSLEETTPERIPDQLWPRAKTKDQAVSVRDSGLLRHIERCPEIVRTLVFILNKGSVPAAYFLLTQVRRDVRLADYGPVGLDGETSRQLALAAQVAAHRYFTGIDRIFTATAEATCAKAWAEAGLVAFHTEPIRALKLNEELQNVSRFRLTLLDWDLLCL